MFSAIMKRKHDVEVKEDSITSSVFDTLLLLPDELFWEILKSSCYDNDSLPPEAGKIEYYEFWPHWDSEGTENEKHVEPDLYIQFEKFDIIIEAKKEYNLQSKVQWEKEVVSYMNEYAENEKSAYLIAIDGILNEESEEVQTKAYGKFRVFKSKWSTILDVCTEKLQGNSEDHQKRLMSVVVEYLQFYGFLKYIWLDEIINERMQNIEYNDDTVILISRIGSSMVEPNKSPCSLSNTFYSTIVDYGASIDIVGKIGGKL